MTANYRLREDGSGYYTVLDRASGDKIGVVQKISRRYYLTRSVTVTYWRATGTDQHFRTRQDALAYLTGGAPGWCRQLTLPERLTDSCPCLSVDT